MHHVKLAFLAFFFLVPLHVLHAQQFQIVTFAPTHLFAVVVPLIFILALITILASAILDCIL